MGTVILRGLPSIGRKYKLNLTKKRKTWSAKVESNRLYRPVSKISKCFGHSIFQWRSQSMQIIIIKMHLLFKKGMIYILRQCYKYIMHKC